MAAGERDWNLETLEREMFETREDFPILQRQVNGHPLIYFDNGATAQHPRVVFDAMEDYFFGHHANPHRGAHRLAMEATEMYEAARRRVAVFLHAYRVSEVIFTRGATESLNLLAFSLGLETLKEGDEILISILEHHANLVPWQRVARHTGAQLVYVYPNDEGVISVADLEAKMTPRTKIVSLTGCSNVTGARPDLPALFAAARKINPEVVTIADLAQLVPHAKVDVREIGCDFAAFSSHKIYAGMGHGVLWGRYEKLSAMEPFLLGGDMVVSVTEQDATFHEPAQRFEAGTQNVEVAIGLAAAIDYLEGIGMDKIEAWEYELGRYAQAKLREVPGLTIYSVPDSPVISFNIEGVHPHDVSTILDAEAGVAIRTGHHCAQPLHRYLGLAATCRASLSFYNTKEEIDRMVEAVREVPKLMGL